MTGTPEGKLSGHHQDQSTLTDLAAHGITQMRMRQSPTNGWSHAETQMTKNVLAFFSRRKSTTGHALTQTSQQDVTETRDATVNYKMKGKTEVNDGKLGGQLVIVEYLYPPTATDAARNQANSTPFVQSRFRVSINVTL